ncbi:MAG: 8-oxo-dGTP diphosphatase MutT [Pseudomonadota bacterium]
MKVVAAALVRSGAAPQVLIAQRPMGKWQAGRWEFPGGKIEAGESPHDALLRELREELGIQVQAAQSLGQFTHAYADRSVEIDLWLVTQFAREPQGLDGQALRWVSIDELAACDLLEADRPMIEPLRQSLGQWQLGTLAK